MGCLMKYRILLAAVICGISGIGDIAIGVLKETEHTPLINATEAIPTAVWMIVGFATEVVLIFGCISISYDSSSFALLFTISSFALFLVRVVMGFIIFSAEQIDNTDSHIRRILFIHTFAVGLTHVKATICGCSTIREIQQQVVPVDRKILVTADYTADNGNIV